jgi:hypothetical protein
MNFYIFFKNRLPDRVKPEPAGNQDPGKNRVPVPVPVAQNKESGYPGSGSRFWPKTEKPDRIDTPTFNGKSSSYAAKPIRLRIWNGPKNLGESFKFLHIATIFCRYG